MRFTQYCADLMLFFGFDVVVAIIGKIRIEGIG
jgi:hypothetical protein